MQEKLFLLLDKLQDNPWNQEDYVIIIIGMIEETPILINNLIDYAILNSEDLYSLLKVLKKDFVVYKIKEKFEHAMIHQMTKLVNVYDVFSLWLTLDHKNKELVKNYIDLIA